MPNRDLPETTAPPDRHEPRRVWLAAVAALACVPLVLLAMSPQVLRGTNIVEQGSVSDLYYKTAMQVRGGAVPYRDFLLEYPLLSVPVVVLPILAGTSRLVYAAAFIFEILVINAVLIQLVAWVVDRDSGRGRLVSRLVWYCALFTLLSRTIVSRIDLAPTLLAFWSSVLWYRGKSVRGGILAALGALMKIFPGFVVLPAALWEAFGAGGKKKFQGFAAFVIVMTVGVAVWWVIGGKGAIESLTYHSERGLEIESLYAGLLMAVGPLAGGRYSAPFDHGSFNLIGPGADTLSKLSGLLQIALVGVTLLQFARAGFRSGPRFTLAVLLATISTAKVLSPQYYIWLLPFVVVLDDPVGRTARPLYAMICFLTLVIYPFMFDPIIEFHTGGILLLNLRNVLSLVLWWLVTFGSERELVAPQPAPSL